MKKKYFIFIVSAVCILFAGCVTTNLNYNILGCDMDEILQIMINDGYVDYAYKNGELVYSSGGDNSAPTGDSSSAALADTSSNQPANNQSTGQSSASKKPSKPVYTQEQIDAAWEETSRTEPTCIEVGVIEYENSITHDTKTEEIPLVDHIYKLTETVDATCTIDGHKTYTCEVCKDSYDEGIPATGHGEGVVITTTEPQWFSEGVDTEYCSICNAELSAIVIPQKAPISFNAFIMIIAGIVAALIAIICAIVVNRKKNK